MENPTNRYEQVLTRRCTRKHTNGVQQDAEQGDVTLGFKMKIIAGRVIVSGVKPELIDGSPTPCKGSKMKRGDVVLSFNGQSLVVEGEMSAEARTAKARELLLPLITPNEDGIYEKTVHFELARGEGLKLLLRVEAVEESQRMTDESNNSRRRSWRFGSGNGRPAVAEEEGYATLDMDWEGVPQNQNKKDRRRVSGAAAVAGIAGLALMGPITAVVAAGAAGVAVHANNKKKRENSIK